MLSLIFPFLSRLLQGYQFYFNLLFPLFVSNMNATIFYNTAIITIKKIHSGIYGNREKEIKFSHVRWSVKEGI